MEGGWRGGRWRIDGGLGPRSGGMGYSRQLRDSAIYGGSEWVSKTPWGMGVRREMAWREKVPCATRLDRYHDRSASAGWA